jgi:hypothetical protein
MDVLKSVGSKVATGVAALVVVAGAISWWQMDPATRQGVITGLGRFGAWLAVVLLLPWATFFLIGRIAKLESNLAGAVLVGIYTIAEFAVLVWLFNPTLTTPAAWTAAAAAGLLAGVYNLFTCDWIAEKVA